MPGDDFDRRDVLRGGLWAAGFGPLCCASPEAPAGSFHWEQGRVVIDLNKAVALRRTGAAVAVVDTEQKFNLIVIHVDRGLFVALDRSCTHNYAQCAYNGKRRTVQCTSLNHAEFDLNGKLLHGRTHGDLRAYETRREGSRLLIAVGNSG